jgi:hypothetical protein
MLDKQVGVGVNQTNLKSCNYMYILSQYGHCHQYRLSVSLW